MQIGSRILIALTRERAKELCAAFSTLADDDGICVMKTVYSEAVSEAIGLTVSACQSLIRPDPMPRDYRLDRPELTEDMVESIERYFPTFEKNGRILVESNIRGLWFVCPTGRRPFIGLARLVDREPRVAQVVASSQTHSREQVPCPRQKK